MQAPGRTSSGQWIALAISIAICFGAAGLGAALTDVSVDDWYVGLNKPAWNPPNWIFGPVWSALYLGMAIAAWLVWRQRQVDPRVGLSLFGVQLILNVAWSGLFFGLRNPAAAFVDVILLWWAILATIFAFARSSRGGAVLLVPYIGWVSFAALLNWTIWRMNP